MSSERYDEDTLVLHRVAEELLFTTPYQRKNKWDWGESKKRSLKNAP